MLVFTADCTISKSAKGKGFSNCFAIRLCCDMQLAFTQITIHKASEMNHLLVIKLIIKLYSQSAHAIHCQLMATQYHMQTKHNNRLYYLLSNYASL